METKLGSLSHFNQRNVGLCFLFGIAVGTACISPRYYESKLPVIDKPPPSYTIQNPRMSHILSKMENHTCCRCTSISSSSCMPSYNRPTSCMKTGKGERWEMRNTLTDWGVSSSLPRIGVPSYWNLIVAAQDKKVRIDQSTMHPEIHKGEVHLSPYWTVPIWNQMRQTKVELDTSIKKSYSSRVQNLLQTHRSL